MIRYLQEISKILLDLKVVLQRLSSLLRTVEYANRQILTQIRISFVLLQCMNWCKQNTCQQQRSQTVQQQPNPEHSTESKKSISAELYDLSNNYPNSDNLVLLLYTSHLCGHSLMDLIEVPACERKETQNLLVLQPPSPLLLPHHPLNFADV